MARLRPSEFPSTWQIAAVGAIAEISYGKALHEEDRAGEGGIPVFGSSGIIGEHNQALHPGPSAIIGRKGSVGEVNYVSGAFWCIDTTFYINTVDPLVEVEFLAHMLRVINLSRLSISVGVPGLNRQDILTQEIPIPPLPEQRRIVAILREAEELRRSVTQVVSRVLRGRVGSRPGVNRALRDIG
jgi:type I restriction enzyme, S subunit